MPSEASSKSRQLALVAMTIANAMILVDQTAVPLALPAIEKQFGVGTQVAQWVLSASLLALSGLLILGGRLGDLLGRRRMFVTGLIGFTAASVVGGLAPVFPFLLAARVIQGIGGALMLPCSVAIVNDVFPRQERGKALGTLGGAAAVAGALGPTIGGALTTVSWRLVLLVNLPLAVVCLWATVSAVPRDPPRQDRVSVDLIGAGLLCFSIVALVFGFNETQSEQLTSPVVLGPVALAVLSGFGFVSWERRSPDPLMDIGLLRRTPNYLGATISQALGGFVEMGLGLIFPLLLILDLGMSPFVAGLALIPTTVPIVLFSTTIGRWYDRSGGRPPLVVGFGVLALSGLALGIGVHLLQPAAPNYLFLLPGLLLFGTGLAFVLTACDPVSLDSVDQDLAGQVSGVSATAEQGGGAIGIAGLYAIFHQVYVRRLAHLTHSGSPHGLTPHQSEQLRQALQAAEQTGLQPNHFDQALVRFLVPAFEASKLGYAAVFFSVIAVSAVGSAAAWRLVRKPAGHLPPPLEAVS
jgi:EmrB/QacA subfamily drug resistance transporter